jgi:hypothetical protein
MINNNEDGSTNEEEFDLGFGLDLDWNMGFGLANYSGQEIIIDLNDDDDVNDQKQVSRTISIGSDDPEGSSMDNDREVLDVEEKQQQTKQKVTSKKQRREANCQPRMKISDIQSQEEHQALAAFLKRNDEGAIEEILNKRKQLRLKGIRRSRYEHGKRKNNSKKTKKNNNSCDATSATIVDPDKIEPAIVVNVLQGVDIPLFPSYASRPPSPVPLPSIVLSCVATAKRVPLQERKKRCFPYARDPNARKHIPISEMTPEQLDRHRKRSKFNSKKYRARHLESRRKGQIYRRVTKLVQIRTIEQIGLC